MRRPMKRLTAVAAALVIAAGGCDQPLSSAEQVTRLTAEGWGQFRVGNYAGAEDCFRRAAAVNFSDPEVQLGLGWALLEERMLGDAIIALARIGPRDPLYPHAQAGLAIAADASGRFDDVIPAAEAVLTADSTYTFPYDSSIDWRDLTFLLTKSYLVLSPRRDPTLTQTTDVLRRIDLDPPLVPGNPATWTANGLQWSTLAEAALKRLEATQAAISSAVP